MFPEAPPADVLTAAFSARDAAYVPYSGRKVGVAFATDKGLWKQSAFESCAYPTSRCAVWAGINTAMAAGVRKFKCVVVVGAKDTPRLCGCCREALASVGEIPVYLIHPESKLTKRTSPSELLAGELDLVKLSSQSLINYSGHQDLQTIFKPSEENLPVEDELLCKAAILACRSAVVPISNFPVGAALLTSCGKILQSANTEFPNLMPLGLCAERNVILSAVSEGYRSFQKIAVVCYKSHNFGRPCGACRQMLVEWGDFQVLMVKLNPETQTFEVEESTTLKILPGAFTPAEL